MPRKYIYHYITYDEYKCSHCGKLPAEFYHDDGGRREDVPLVYKPIFEAFASIREEWGKPIYITSGYRCPDYQQRLIDNGVSHPLSAHMFGMALDMDCKNVKEVNKMYEVIKENQPELRVGYYIDTGTFIHIDTAYLIKPRLTPAWRPGITWSK